jgi:hypothetical protein
VSLAPSTVADQLVATELTPLRPAARLQVQRPSPSSAKGRANLSHKARAQQAPEVAPAAPAVDAPAPTHPPAPAPQATGLVSEAEALHQEAERELDVSRAMNKNGN